MGVCEMTRKALVVEIGTFRAKNSN